LWGLVAALTCHSALAADSSNSQSPDRVYLWVALGGALGGVFNALVAPVAVTSLIEYLLASIAACLLRPQASGARPGILELLGVDARVQRLVDVTLPAVFGLAVAAALCTTATTGADALTRR
jgi:hypothetical protein